LYDFSFALFYVVCVRIFPLSHSIGELYDRTFNAEKWYCKILRLKCPLFLMYLLMCGMGLHNYLSPVFFIGVAVSRILRIHTILIFDLGIVSTVWYFLLFILLSISNSMIYYIIGLTCF